MYACWYVYMRISTNGATRCISSVASKAQRNTAHLAYRVHGWPLFLQQSWRRFSAPTLCRAYKRFDVIPLIVHVQVQPNALALSTSASLAKGLYFGE